MTPTHLCVLPHVYANCMGIELLIDMWAWNSLSKNHSNFHFPCKASECGYLCMSQSYKDNGYTDKFKKSFPDHVYVVFELNVIHLKVYVEVEHR